MKGGPEMSIRNDTAAILRSHGINAYEQSTDIVIYSATSSRWEEVRRFPINEDQCLIAPQLLANIIARTVAELVAGPHSHDLEIIDK